MILMAKKARQQGKATDIKQQNMALKKEFLTSLFRCFSPTKQQYSTGSRADLETEFLASFFLCLSSEDQEGILRIMNRLVHKINLAQAAKRVRTHDLTVEPQKL